MSTKNTSELDKFHLKDGQLSAHGLKCGYVQQASAGVCDIEMWQENNAYHVRRYDQKKRAKGLPLDAWFEWKAYPSLAEARKQFRSFISQSNKEARLDA